MGIGLELYASARARWVAGFVVAVIVLVAAAPVRGQTSTLPSPQRTQDIGSPRVAGSAAYSSGAYTIKGSGADIGGSADQFRFVFQPIAGDFDVSVRVASISAKNTWAKVGVMVREALTAGSTNAFALISARRGYAFERRGLAGGTTDMTSGGNGGAPGWVRLVRSGAQFDAYRSNDGKTWTLMGTDVIDMPDSVYVGMAVTSHATQSLATASLDTFTVKQTAAPNAPPTVSLTSPGVGATFTAPATIALAAQASDPEGHLARVEFYSGATKLATATTSPYTGQWSNVPAGTYTLTAIAYDADGGQTTSPAVTVQVKSANAAPSVTLTAPASGTTYTAPASVSLAATATDSDGTIAKVEFYRGTTLLATDTAAPYAWTWSSVAAGSYSLTAVAYDNVGAKKTSNAVSVTVNAVLSMPRAVQFQASADHATLVTSYRLDVFANGANPSTATPVTSANLGKPTPDANNNITVDESVLFAGLAPGTYLATVSAIGSGGSSRSAAVSFTR